MAMGLSNFSNVGDGEGSVGGGWKKGLLPRDSNLPEYIPDHINYF